MSARLGGREGPQLGCDVDLMKRGAGGEEGSKIDFLELEKILLLLAPSLSFPPSLPSSSSSPRPLSRQSNVLQQKGSHGRPPRSPKDERSSRPLPPVLSVSLPCPSTHTEYGSAESLPPRLSSLLSTSSDQPPCFARAPQTSTRTLVRLSPERHDARVRPVGSHPPGRGGAARRRRLRRRSRRTRRRTCSPSLPLRPAAGAPGGTGANIGESFPTGMAPPRALVWRQA